MEGESQISTYERFGPRKRTREEDAPATVKKERKGSFSRQGSVKIKVQFAPALFERMVAISERMVGKDGRQVRRAGLKAWKQGKNGKTVGNTTGLPKAMKTAMLYYEGDEGARVAKQADARAKLEKAKEDAKAAGLRVE